MKYKVLLIDDKFQHESVQAIVNSARQRNIEIIGNLYHEEGMKQVLDDQLHSIQAVILDARGFQNKEDEIDTNRGLYYSLNKLQEINKKRILPWFVYTGAPKNISNDDFIHSIAPFQSEYKFGSVSKVYYTKTIDDIVLLNDVIEEIQKSLNTNVVLKNKLFFEACGFLEIPQMDMDKVYQVFQQIEANNVVNIITENYNLLRKMLEYLLRHAIKYGIVHERCLDERDRVNISQSVRFLSGKPSDILAIKCKKAILPTLLQCSLDTFLKVTNAASHTNEENNGDIINFNEYKRVIQTTYLYKQMVYVLCDLYVWYKQYVTDNTNIEDNKIFWITNSIQEPIAGYIQKNERGDLYVSNCLLPKNWNYKLGDYLTIKVYEESKNSYFSFYAKFAEHIKVEHINDENNSYH